MPDDEMIRNYVTVSPKRLAFENRARASRSDLPSCPTPTLVLGSPAEPRGSWTSLRGRAVAQPDLDNLEPIENPTAAPYFICSHPRPIDKAARTLRASRRPISVNRSLPRSRRSRSAWTLTALPITSAGRFSPRGPRGMFYRRGNL